MNRRPFFRLIAKFSAATATAGLLAAAAAQPARACMPYPMPVAATPPRADALHTVLAMPSDADLQARARQQDLGVMNVMWEDTGRFEGSAVGPNISDLTLQVREPAGRHGVRTYPLPVIRHPNFTDRTGDVAAEKLFVRVGNQRAGGQLTAVPLTEVLRNLQEYLTVPSSLRGNTNFLAPRDTHMLVSAQHVFLPLGASGKVEFNPVIYNYQSSPGAPAVLALLITREGMSATVVENRAGDQTAQGQGQQLFFNKGGQRTAFTAERRSAVKQRMEAGKATEDDRGALEEGADMMMLVQIPLRVPERLRAMEMEDGSGMGGLSMAAPSATKGEAKMSRRAGGGVSDVENAVLGHGAELGPFVEGNNLSITRDERFPIRVTVQFYRATSNGVVSNQDLADVHQAIEKVYSSADYVGSLVVPQGGRHRPTDWIKDQPAGAWGVVSR